MSVASFSPACRLHALKPCRIGLTVQTKGLRYATGRMSVRPCALSSQDELKKQAAHRAVEYVESGMVLGLGTGSTTAFAVDRIGELLSQGKIKDIVGVPTSIATYEQAKRECLPNCLAQHLASGTARNICLCLFQVWASPLPLWMRSLTLIWPSTEQMRSMTSSMWSRGVAEPFCVKRCAMQAEACNDSFRVCAA